MRRRRARDLNAEEKALWAHVVQHVTPLHRMPAPEPVETPASPASEEPRGEKPVPAARPASAPSGRKASKPPAPPPPPPLMTLEPKARRRLGRGAEVDARLDLHGLTQTAAHHRLRLFLMDAQAQGYAVVLVITGKGGAEKMERADDLRLGLPAMFGEERGVLRRAVPHWLAAPDLRMVVLGFEEAGRRHGGEGALYVRIRRRR